MSGEFERYALYWVPRRNDALAQFGVSWTGWCAEKGEPRPRGKFHGVSVNIPAITRKVRCHGLHGVLKAPFRLAVGRSRFSLEHVLGQLAEDNVSLRLPRLHLAVVEGYVALAPGKNCGDLVGLITRIGDAADPLDEAAPANGFSEAPATVTNGAVAGDNGGDAETLVQLPAADAHRFHIPLTDPIGLETAFKVMEELEPVLEPILDDQRWLNDIALIGDPGYGRSLRVLERYDLRNPWHWLTSDALPTRGRHVLAPAFSGSMDKASFAI